MLSFDEPGLVEWQRQGTSSRASSTGSSALQGNRVRPMKFFQADLQPLRIHHDPLRGEELLLHGARK